LKNLRKIYSDEKTPTELFGWSRAKNSKTHDFAVRCVCADIGPALIFDKAINGNYIPIYVEDRSRVEEVRKNFEKIVFTSEDIEGTSMNYYTPETLTRRYMEVIGVTPEDPE
jgi:hypothetical protein